MEAIQKHDCNWLKRLMRYALKATYALGVMLWALSVKRKK